MIARNTGSGEGSVDGVQENAASNTDSGILRPIRSETSFGKTRSLKRAGIPRRAMAGAMDLRAQFVAGGELRIDGGCQTGTRSP